MFSVRRKQISKSDSGRLGQTNVGGNMASFGYNVKLGVDAREFEKGMKSLSKSLQGIGKGLKQAGDDLKWISATAAAALAGIVKTSVSFEDAWVGVTKTVEGTEEQLARVKQEIINMSKVTGISKNEIAGVAQAAGQLGIATDDLSSFTKVMVDLGIATNMTAEEAAMNLARFANITQMSSKDYDRLGATITDLGNNFAVTEREIVEMATRLASTGDLVGLNQAQIMALATAMGSLGSEAEAGGTAMSKLFRKMQLAVGTNNKQLKQFAEVSGMSVVEFKKAFETDALGALNAFTKGLAKIQDNGGSAIATLDEMKLSEVRLSDATLRLVGSGDLLDRSIATANKAWEENTALTKEANKRYNELKYQWGKLKETFGELAIRLGDVLLPTLKKVVTNATKGISDITKKLDGMSKFEKEGLLKILAVIASLSPALKIAGSALTTFGRTIKTLANPTNLLAVAMTALVAGMYAYAKAQEYEIHGMKGLKDTLDEERESWNGIKEARANALGSAMTEIDISQNLANELGRIVDENGKVKEGYEDRAKFIVGELNKALGTEISLNDGVIDGYKDIREEIDKVIRAKKVEATLDAYQEQYSEALKNRAKATEHIVELQKQWDEANQKAVTSSGYAKVKAEQTRATITKALQEETSLIGEFGYTIQNYEKLQEASAEGSAEAIDEALSKIGTSYDKVKQKASESINEQITKQQESLEILRRKYSESLQAHDEYQASVYQSQIEAEQQQLDELYNSLTKQTAMVSELTPEQIAAFENLSKSDLATYQKYVSQLSPEMQAELAKVTGVISSNTSVEGETQNLANDAARIFGVGIREMPNTQSSVLTDTAGVINSNTSVPTAAGNLGSNTNTEYNKNADGQGAGENFSTGVASGIFAKAGEAIAAASSLAKNVIGRFRADLDEHSPSRETAKIGRFFVQGFINGITSSQANAINAVDNLASKTLGAFQSGAMIGDVQGEFGNIGTKVVYTTPNIVINTQELDSQKLEQIVSYVDRRFGASY